MDKTKMEDDVPLKDGDLEAVGGGVIKNGRIEEVNNDKTNCLQRCQCVDTDKIVKNDITVEALCSLY